MYFPSPSQLLIVLTILLSITATTTYACITITNALVTTGTTYTQGTNVGFPVDDTLSWGTMFIKFNYLGTNYYRVVFNVTYTSTSRTVNMPIYSSDLTTTSTQSMFINNYNRYDVLTSTIDFIRPRYVDPRPTIAFHYDENVGGNFVILGCTACSTSTSADYPCP